MLLLGLGAGMALGRSRALDIPASNWVLLCLAASFLAIFLLGLLLGTSKHWWPLVPGLVLLVAGGAQYASRLDFFPSAVETAVRTWWPAALVLAGAFLLYKALRK
jgi:CHASE2 domain-containing sensor protein